MSKDTKSITTIHAIIRKKDKKKTVRVAPGTTFDCPNEAPTFEADGYIQSKAAAPAVVAAKAETVAEKPAVKKPAVKKPADKKPAKEATAPKESAADKKAREEAEAAAAKDGEGDGTTEDVLS